MIQLISVKLKSYSKILHLEFNDGTISDLSCEYLRVYSPSAEVKGHSPEQAILQTDKEHVNIKSIEPVGNYAIKLIFDDGHDSGIYTWDYLYQLSVEKNKLWAEYIDALKQAGYDRKKDEEI